QEYLGHVGQGDFPGRIGALTETILRRLEDRLGEPARDLDLPDRVTQLRRRVIKQLEGLPDDDPQRARLQRDMDDVGRAVELYSYAHDYDLGPLSPERVAEILDKFEEDVLGAATATVRAARR